MKKRALAALKNKKTERYSQDMERDRIISNFISAPPKERGINHRRKNIMSKITKALAKKIKDVNPIEVCWTNTTNNKSNCNMSGTHLAKKSQRLIKINIVNIMK